MKKKLENIFFFNRKKLICLVLFFVGFHEKSLFQEVAPWCQVSEPSSVHNVLALYLRRPNKFIWI